MTTTDTANPRRANDLTGREWLRLSISVIGGTGLSSEERKVEHPAKFPTALAERLIQMFTCVGATVLDPFAGVGSTLLAAQALGRHAVGIELSPDFAETARARCAAAADAQQRAIGRTVVHTGDVRRLREFVTQESIDLVVTSPPYWDILQQRRTADRKPIRNYGTNNGDLGAPMPYHEFLQELQSVFRGTYETLRPGGYCCAVVKDLRKGKQFYPLHSDLAGALQQLGFIYDDLMVWDRRDAYNCLRPAGYPSVFRINNVHEFVLILRKPTNARSAELDVDREH